MSHTAAGGTPHRTGRRPVRRDNVGSRYIRPPLPHFPCRQDRQRAEPLVVNAERWVERNGRPDKVETGDAYRRPAARRVALADPPAAPPPAERARMVAISASSNAL